MRALSRQQINDVLDDLFRLGNDLEPDDLDVRLFRLFDDRELRRQRCLIENFIEDQLPPDSTGLHEAILALQPRVQERWAVVDPFVYVDNDYRDTAPPEAFTELAGYRDASGVFVPTPSLSRLPRFCSSIDDAIRFKDMAFGPYLFLQWLELEDDDGFTEYQATLIEGEGKVISTRRGSAAPVVIVGAVLQAMATGWTHRLAKFHLE